MVSVNVNKTNATQAVQLTDAVRDVNNTSIVGYSYDGKTIGQEITLSTNSILYTSSELDATTGMPDEDAASSWGNLSNGIAYIPFVKDGNRGDTPATTYDQPKYSDEVDASAKLTNTLNPVVPEWQDYSDGSTYRICEVDQAEVAAHWGDQVNALPNQTEEPAGAFALGNLGEAPTAAPAAGAGWYSYSLDGGTTTVYKQYIAKVDATYKLSETDAVDNATIVDEFPAANTLTAADLGKVYKTQGAVTEGTPKLTELGEALLVAPADKENGYYMEITYSRSVKKNEKKVQNNVLAVSKQVVKNKEQNGASMIAADFKPGYSYNIIFTLYEDGSIDNTVKETKYEEGGDLGAEEYEEPEP
jgi:hypothetical protein